MLFGMVVKVKGHGSSLRAAARCEIYLPEASLAASALMLVHFCFLLTN